MAAYTQAKAERLGGRIRIFEQFKRHGAGEGWRPKRLGLFDGAGPHRIAVLLLVHRAVVGRPAVGVARDPADGLARRADRQHWNVAMEGAWQDAGVGIGARAGGVDQAIARQQAFDDRPVAAK
jgi:hypothetical protein